MRRNKLAPAALVLVLIAIYFFGLYFCDMSPGRLTRGIESGMEFFRELAGSFRSEDAFGRRGIGLLIWRLAVAVMETILIAYVGTITAGAVAILLAICGARNIVGPRWALVAKSAFGVIRSVPTLVFALLFVSMVGLGPFSGVLAVCMHSTGALAKLFSEAFEDVPPNALRGLAAMGAARAVILRYGVLWNAAPALVTHLLYMFELNFRSASVLGLVGAGGIGFYLATYLRSGDWPKLTVAIVLVATVIALNDWFASRMRAYLR